ncbi:MAG: response regulator [Magnetococcus sp. DMHC-6]
MQKRTAFLIDDDEDSLHLLKAILSKEGYQVTTENNSELALVRIEEEKPDCVLLDIMMPKMDGLIICKLLRANPDLKYIRIIVVSAKPYEFDRKRAFEFGADGYFTKPVQPQLLLTGLERIFRDAIDLTFWGVRGTHPVPGADTLKYGGNTNCLSLDFPKGPSFIFDAGTGLKILSNKIMAQKQFPYEAKLFISHPHWDHINGLPFFAPLYIQGNEFEICGAYHNDVTTRELISGQMDGVYFPIKIKEFSARVYFKDLKEETLQFNNGIVVHTMLLNHPGHCLGYRVEYHNRTICYITDNELYPPHNPHHNTTYWNKLTQFVANCDALIIDSTYFDHEYELKKDWGHSAISQVAELAHRSLTKTLFLYHHDPDQTDADIDRKLEIVNKILQDYNSNTRCIAPKERELYSF